MYIYGYTLTLKLVVYPVINSPKAGCSALWFFIAMQPITCRDCYVLFIFFFQKGERGGKCFKTVISSLLHTAENIKYKYT